MNSTQKYIDTLKGSAKDVQAALAELADQSLHLDLNEKRFYRRVRLADELTVQVELVHPGGGHTRCRVSTFDISEGGIGLLHGSFVHPNTRCSVLLKSLSGATFSIKGNIVHCRNIRGRVHYVGVRFDEALDVRRFVKTDDEDQSYDSDLVEHAARRIQKLAIEGCEPKLLHAAFEQLGAAMRYPWS